MNINIYGNAILFFLISFAIEAQESHPVKLDYSKISPAKPLYFYANLRTLYGEGIESVIEGRNREDNEQFRLGLRYQRFLPYNWFLKGDLRGVFVHRHDSNNFNSEEIWDAHFEVRQLFLEKKHLITEFPIGLLAGRKQFRDQRGWWYDNQLDIAQIQYNSTLLTAELSYGGRLIDERVISETQNIGFEDSKFLIAHLDYQFFYQNDDFSANKTGRVRDANTNLDPELDLLWLGIRFNGLFSLSDRSQLSYWADFALANGSKRSYRTSSLSPAKKVISSIRDIDVKNAYAFDLGTTWKSSDNRWGLSLNYAYGSGDQSGADNSSQFIQPTISNNKGKTFEELRHRIYGQLLRPELSNLQILSLTTGHRLNEYLFLQASYFHYWQIEASPELEASNLSISPNGRNKEIGNEIDVILQGSWYQNLVVELTFSGFHAGDAFDHVRRSEFAYKGLLEIRFEW